MPRPPTPFSRRLSNCQSHLEISSRLFAIRRFLESVFVSERLFILDAHSLIYQLFHAIPEMTSPSGVPTNAVFGFVRDILQLRKDRKPDYLVCAFDTPAKVFRSDIDPNYKAHRPPQPDDLRPQIPLIVRVLQAFRIPVLGQDGFEADDFLATVAVEGAKRGIDVYLCTADKDVRQVVGPHVKILDLRRNRLIDRDYVINDWGIAPEQVVDYQAMVGDSVDNVCGIKGVGAKTASALLQKYGTLENIFEHVDEVPGVKMKQNIMNGKTDAFRCRELVRLRTDVPLPEDWSAWRPHKPNRAELLDLFRECGFHRFADDIMAEAPEEAEKVAEWKADYKLVQEPWDFDAFLGELKKQKRFCIDLETTSLSPRLAEIVGIAICWSPGVAYYLPLKGPEGAEVLDAKATLNALKPILENPKIEKINQNIKYDLLVLRAQGVEMQGLAFDSMIASYLLEPGERSHNLDDLSRRLLGHETIKIRDLFPKDVKLKGDLPITEVPLDRITEYAAEDADVAWRLCEKLQPTLEQEKLFTLFRDVEMPLVEVLAEMEYNGVKVEPTRLQGLSEQFAVRLKEIETEAHRLAGHPFNLDSPTQLRVVLFEELKLPIIKRTKTGPSTDQEVLEELADESDVCAAIIEHRKLSKLKNTYLDNLATLINPNTGRIHASFNQTVAATGRLSSSDPNLQNIPVRTEEGRQIRQAFLPGDSNQVLVAADYSQIELRLLAHFSQDPALTRAFAEDVDIHTAVAAKIAGVPLADVTAEQRRLAKTVNFGVMYGVSAFGLGRRLKISQQDASKFIHAYYDQHPKVEAFFTDLLVKAERERQVTTILGRRRPITGVRNPHGRTRNLAERTAINTIIQGSAADLIKMAMLNIHRRLKKEKLDARMLLQIHDELVFEVHKDQVEPLAELVVQEMTGALKLDGVPLAVDVGVGPNWLDLEPIDVRTAA
jgi:DNA polymerase I